MVDELEAKKTALMVDLDTCSTGHDVIAYTSHSCPLCIEQCKVSGLQDEIYMLNEEINEGK